MKSNGDAASLKIMEFILSQTSHIVPVLMVALPCLAKCVNKFFFQHVAGVLLY